MFDDAILVFVACMVGVVGICCWMLWTLMIRPYLLAMGRINPTAADFIVRGWKAEREGRNDDALDAYDSALRLQRINEDAKQRRAALLERCPELVPQAEMNSRRLAEERARKNEAIREANKRAKRGDRSPD